MTPKPILGLIGGIGAGKSFVAQAFAAFGGCIVSGDEAGHLALVQEHIRNAVLHTFGNELVKNDGSIDRRKLGQIVFGDRTQLARLEAIVFPWIEEELRNKINLLQSDPKCRFIVLDAAIMLEAGWSDVCDKIVFIEAPLSVRQERVALRGWSAQDLQKRESAQLPLEMKRSRADEILHNDSKSPAISSQIEKILQKWHCIGV